MPTKAGMVKLADCVNGKTFYEVRITIDTITESFTTKVRPIFCCSRGYNHALDKVMDARTRQSYMKNPMVWFEYDRPQRAHKERICGGIMFSAYQHPLKTSNNLQRLFTTQAFAERYVKFLEQTFVPSDKQTWDAYYAKKWNDEYYEEEMERLGKELGIVDGPQVVENPIGS